MIYINNRVFQILSEPSTWAGVSTLLIAFGLSREKVDLYILLATSLSSILSIFLREGSK
jgi:hypothetical protein